MTQLGRLTRLVLVALLPAIAGCQLGDTVEAQTRAAADTGIRFRITGVRADADTSTAARLSSAFREAAGRGLPAVVQVRVTTGPDANPRAGRSRRPDVERRGRSTGSGFIVDDRGHVVTNNHVVEGAERLAVVLSDGREFDAALVGGDPNTDVAVIRIETRGSEPLPIAEIGDSDALSVGDWVLALGNPLGLQFTVTAGIVSAKGRAINILDSPDNTALEAFIQTDAAINPGNSGGPLVDLLGRVVGINSAIESRTGFFSGAGFAIPINLATRIADDLVRHGVVHRPRIGVVIQDVNAADAEVYGLAEIAGAEIASVSPGTPAERGGLAMGDVVVGVNGDAIRSVTDLQARVARFQPGETVRLELIRYGDRLHRSIQLGEFAPAPERAVPVAPARRGADLLGFDVGELSSETGSLPGLRLDARVRIVEVVPFGPAEEAFVPRNVVLLRLNGTDIATTADVARVAASIERGDVVSIVTLNPRVQDAAPTIYNYRAR